MSSEKPIVLFVDDEPAFAQRYVEELEKHFQVVYLTDAGEALNVLVRRATEIKALILDVMMPTPKDVPDSETDDGFETGLWLLQAFRGVPGSRWLMPVVILTNRRTDLIHDGLRRRKIDESGVVVYRKIDMPAFALPRRLQALMEAKRR